MFAGMKARRAGRRARLAAEMVRLEWMMAENQTRLDEIDRQKVEGCKWCKAMEAA